MQKMHEFDSRHMTSYFVLSRLDQFGRPVAKLANTRLARCRGWRLRLQLWKALLAAVLEAPASC